MKKRIAGVLAAAAVILAAAEASAYSLYSQNCTAGAAASQISEELAAVNSQLAQAAKTYTPNADLKALEQEGGTSEPTQPEQALGYDIAEFAGLYDTSMELSQRLMDTSAAQTNALIKKLMEYDISLKKLKLANERYNRLKANTEKLRGEYRTGGCDYSQYESAQKETETAYYSIKELIFGISVLKGEIESATGEKLTDRFDFNSVYLITDALALEGGTLADMSRLSSIADPVSAQREAEEQPQDYSAQINGAISEYYKLGAALRAYIEACAAYKEGCEELKLEHINAEQLLELQTKKEDEYINVCIAKADYSAALLDLDEAAGGALTASYGVSGGLISECRSVCAEESRGKGLWKVAENNGRRYFSTLSYPMRLGKYKDNYYGYYTVEYSGKQIGKADIGAACEFSAVKYEDGANTAKVTFYEVNGKVYSYNVSVFAPFGGFTATD